MKPTQESEDLFDIESSGQVYLLGSGDRRLLGGIAYLRQGTNAVEGAALDWWKTWAATTEAPAGA